MKRILSLGLCSWLLFAGYPTFASKTYYSYGYSKSGRYKNVHVNGYYKANGTYVNDYYRSSPYN
ncbi:hypothetical protein [Candidatus Liberibacter americanus]|uniref:Uncharacterized protein n=1 Tax=Candidatus Liberibacter americanus str. Sao Paulo TaxID=1261131 RepID=U6B4Q2_9HYPH|nr:hypothetical protein [Candidatus Liberibacter americanus]AHA28049.1 hypothetical protein lam_703 [Candidatus Liberibacter americanus str. Sao Paulo]